jgi:hypothetical protein
MTEEIIVGLVSVIAGCLMLIFRDSFARNIIKFPLWGFNFGEREIKANKFVIGIVGTGFIIFGTLSLSGIIRF